MKKKGTDLLQGTLDLLILQVLRHEPRHGYDIAKRILVVSEEVLNVGQGSLYPALHRLEAGGYVKASWALTERGREAKFYALTAAGRVRLEEEEASWQRFSGAVEQVIAGSRAERAGGRS
jgi:transcriptional regulator